jgi:hypothetical protein
MGIIKPSQKHFPHVKLKSQQKVYENCLHPTLYTSKGQSDSWL